MVLELLFTLLEGENFKKITPRGMFNTLPSRLSGASITHGPLFIKQFYRPKKFSFKTIICLVDDFMSRSSVFTMIILSSQIRIFQFRYRRHALKNNLAIYNDYRWLLGLILLHHLGMVFVISNTVRYTHFLQFFFKNRAVRTGLGYGKYCLHGSSPFFIKS